MDQPKKIVLTPSPEAEAELTKVAAPIVDTTPTQSAPATAAKTEAPAETHISKDWVTPDPLDRTATPSVAATLTPAQQDEQPRDFRSEHLSYEIAGKLAQPTRHARRFLAAYLVSIFSALTLLSGAATLGYVLLDYFIPKETDVKGAFYLDLSAFYISIMASMTVFGALYLAASLYSAKAAADDTIAIKDWRVYKVVYAVFTAILLTVAATVLASFLYIPIAQSMVADDLTWRQIIIQIMGGVSVLLWVAVLIWQERLVKQGAHSKLQGVVVALGALILTVLTAAFPVAGRADDRYDARTVADLTKIQTALGSYKTEHNKLPTTLKDLDLVEYPTVKKRLAAYKYTVTGGTTSDTVTTQRQQVLMQGSESDTDYSSLYNSSMSNDSMSGYGSSARQSYKLCATFRTDTSAGDDPTSVLSIVGTISGSSTFAKHKKGEVCFDR